MNTETPKKSSNTPNKSFSPVILLTSPIVVSPKKNLTGTPRVARDITADLYNNIQKWNGLHIEGCQIIKQIVSLKDSDDSKSNLYTPELETLTNCLWDVMENLKVTRNFFGSLVNQIVSLNKLQKNSEAFFTSVGFEKFSKYFQMICNSYLKEFEMKVVVLEHIAHCKNKAEAMFLASCWTHQLNVTSEINMKLEAILVEAGHRKFY